MQQPISKYFARITAAYTVQNTWTDVIGVTVKEDGIYDISTKVGDVSMTTGRTQYFRISIDGNPILGSEGDVNAVAAVSVAGNYSCTMLAIPVKANQVVSLQAIYGVGAGTINYSFGNQETFICAVKRG